MDVYLNGVEGDRRVRRSTRHLPSFISKCSTSKFRSDVGAPCKDFLFGEDVQAHSLGKPFSVDAEQPHSGLD